MLGPCLWFFREILLYNRTLDDATKLMTLQGEIGMEQQNPQDSPRGNMLSLLLAALLGGGFLLFMIIVSGMFFLYVALAVCALGGIALFHYLLWGQGMMQEVAAERALEEARRRVEDDVDFLPMNSRFRG